MNRLEIFLITSFYYNPVRKHKYIKIVTNEIGSNSYLVSEPNCHTTIFFFRKFIRYWNKKTQIHMNKLVYLGLSILELSKIVICEFWYDYIKRKYDQKAKYVTWIQTVF